MFLAMSVCLSTGVGGGEGNERPGQTCSLGDPKPCPQLDPFKLDHFGAPEPIVKRPVGLQII